MGKASKSVTAIPPPTPQEVNRKAKEKASIHDLKFYDTRHQAITNLDPKLDVLESVETVGHKNLNQLLTYYNKTPAELAKKLP